MFHGINPRRHSGLYVLYLACHCPILGLSGLSTKAFWPPLLFHPASMASPSANPGLHWISLTSPWTDPGLNLSDLSMNRPWPPSKLDFLKKDETFFQVSSKLDHQSFFEKTMKLYFKYHQNLITRAFSEKDETFFSSIIKIGSPEVLWKKVGNFFSSIIKIGSSVFFWKK